jgi:hypothetical protein
MHCQGKASSPSVPFLGFRPITLRRRLSPVLPFRMVWLPWLFRPMFLAIIRSRANESVATSFGLCGFWQAGARIRAARFRPNHSVPLAFASFAIVGGLAVMAWQRCFVAFALDPWLCVAGFHRFCVFVTFQFPFRSVSLSTNSRPVFAV